MKKALVCGAGGFIGSHMVKRLKKEGYFVRGADLKHPQFSPTEADEFMIGNLCDPQFVEKVLDIPFDEVYQLAADMGGLGYIGTGQHDAHILHNSVAINANMADLSIKKGVKKLFFSSSVCIYSDYDPEKRKLVKYAEDLAFPAMPDNNYGWEKLFSEQMYLAFHRNHGLDVRIARFHNIFGPEGTWKGGREKAPAALCRNVATASDPGVLEIWGDGTQTRPFLFIDECIEGVRRLMENTSGFRGPVNLGPEEIISISDLADMIIKISGKKITKKYISGPTGVRNRNSENTLLKEKLGWAPDRPLREGIEKTYAWIVEQVKKEKTS
jgi:GDP-D-mannose 3',5'-epimerase